MLGAPAGITYFGQPRRAAPLAVRLQVAAGVRSFVYQAEQLHALWKTRRSPPKHCRQQNRPLTPATRVLLPAGHAPDLNI